MIKEHRPSTVYISKPSYINHQYVMEAAGLKVEYYRYFNYETKGLDFDGMVEDIRNAPERSIILLHTCGHNPTGVDPTFEQWKILAEVIRERQHYPFFDTAYAGFVTADLETDCASLRYFLNQGF